MKSIDEFADLLRDELGLHVTAEQIGAGFDQVPGWDSVHLLALLTVLERETGRRISFPDVLEAASLRDVYAVAVGE
ncbi:acyl carrier protein [Kitasatospora sp. NPDC059408]|uniref:acyl carrier protein n=1 Tax=Kitasatospora sp. NPDC059408 TaxID=3346823 RepID=UPI0036ACB421